MLPMRHACGQVIELRRFELQASLNGSPSSALADGMDLWCTKCKRFVQQSETSIPQGTLCVVSPRSA